LFLMLIFFLEIYSLNRYQKLFWRSFLFLLPFVFITFSFYGRRPSEYYFNFLVFFLILALASLGKNLIGRVLLLTVITFWFFNFQSALSPNFLSLANKERAVSFLAREAAGKEIFLAFSAPLGEEAGFRYLADYYGIKLSSQSGVPLVKIVIPSSKEKVDKDFSGIGVLLPH